MQDIKKYDSEFYEIFNNFNLNEVAKSSNLNDRDQMLITLACLITNQSLNFYKEVVKEALDLNVSPIEIKEVLYQSVPYLGLSRVYDFFKVTNDTLKERGIELPLEKMATTDKENREVKGYEKQCTIFGRKVIDKMYSSAKEDQKHIQKFLSGYCFGDFYTRKGLNDRDREMITFAIIISLGGCENQLRGHIQGNLNVGNDEKKLISVITQLCPYIGFPRTLNALNIINEICGD